MSPPGLRFEGGRSTQLPIATSLTMAPPTKLLTEQAYLMKSAKQVCWGRFGKHVLSFTGAAPRPFVHRPEAPACAWEGIWWLAGRVHAGCDRQVSGPGCSFGEKILKDTICEVNTDPGTFTNMRQGCAFPDDLRSPTCSHVLSWKIRAGYAHSLVQPESREKRRGERVDSCWLCGLRVIKYVLSREDPLPLGLSCSGPSTWKGLLQEMEERHVLFWWNCFGRPFTCSELQGP